MSLHSVLMFGGSTTCVRNHLKTQHFKHKKVVKDFPDLVNFSWKSVAASIRSSSKECNTTTLSQVVYPMFLATAGMPHEIESVTNHLVMMVCTNNQLINSVLSDMSMNFWEFAFPSLHAVIPGRTKLAGIIKDQYGKMRQILYQRIQSSKCQVSFVIDGWCSRNLKGFFAVIACFMEDTPSGPVICRQLAPILPSINHKGINLELNLGPNFFR
jgi:hypothetical protein